MSKSQVSHVPVLLAEVLEYLAPKKGDRYLDVTAGYGGHASKIIELTQATATLIDRDNDAIKYLSSKFKTETVTIVHGDYLAASQELARAAQKFDLILADLGISSPHLNTASRGFSFQTSGPLDMRMDQSQTLTAETVVNTYSQEELAKTIRDFGEEPKAGKIARAIALNRPIKTTAELARLVERAAHSKWSRLHPATKTFQAIRLIVNDELGQLERALPVWFDLLEPGGRIAIISFHSLEDRLVKQALKSAAGERYDAELKLLSKKPIMASQTEIAINPRARSAKLRAAVKIKTKKKGSFHAN